VDGITGMEWDGEKCTGWEKIHGGGVGWGWEEYILPCHCNCDYAMIREATDNVENGISVAGRTINTIRYADDSALTPLVGRQEGHLACKKNWVLVCWW